VQIDEQDTLLALGECRAEIDGRGGLAHAALLVGDRYRIRHANGPESNGCARRLPCSDCRPPGWRAREASLVIIDALIVLVVVGAAWVGFQRGLVQPLLAELFVLATVLILLHNRDGFAAATEALFHTGGFLAVAVAIVIAGLMGYVGARLGG